MKKKNRLSTILLILGFLVGLVLLLYPSVADAWNRGMAVQTVAHYTDAASELKEEEYKRLKEEAYAYNADMAGFSDYALDAELKDYDAILNLSNDGMMGFIEIDKINVTLPIYHGTDDTYLQIATGHLDWSSLPVGAVSWDPETQTVDPDDGAHSIISGHRGLPSARLFTDLDQVVVGDTFKITVLKDVYAYQVDQIRVVEPEDLSALHIEKGKDYCTLVTCTPYSVNSHRLLIRGFRINPAVSYMVQSNATQVRTYIVAVVMAVPILVLLFLIAVIKPNRFKKKKYIDEQIMDELEIAELPLYRLDLSVMEINRLMKRAEKQDDDREDDEE